MAVNCRLILPTTISVPMTLVPITNRFLVFGESRIGTNVSRVVQSCSLFVPILPILASLLIVNLESPEPSGYLGSTETVENSSSLVECLVRHEGDPTE